MAVILPRRRFLAGLAAALAAPAIVKADTIMRLRGDVLRSRTVQYAEIAFNDYMPPMHPNCRCTIMVEHAGLVIRTGDLFTTGQGALGIVTAVSSEWIYE